MSEIIIIYASEIAKLTRCTDFARKDIANTFETIWKRNRPQTYRSSNARKMVAGINQFINKNTVKVESSSSNMTIEDMKEVSNSYKTMVTLKEMNEKEEISREICGILQNTQLNKSEQTELINAVVGSSELKVGNFDTDTVLDVIKESELKDKDHVMSYYDGMAKKALGSAEEATAQTLYTKKTKKTIHESNSQTFQKKYKTAKNFHFEVRGKIDGLVTDFDEKHRPFIKLVEIKNRTNNLFGGIPYYEKIQLEFYLKVLGLERAELVERLRDEINILPYVRNEELYIKTLKALSRAVDFMIDMWSDAKKIREYQMLSTDERNDYLNKNMPAYLRF
jgi:hypothetical protein